MSFDSCASFNRFHKRSSPGIFFIKFTSLCFIRVFVIWVVLFDCYSSYISRKLPDLANFKDMYQDLSYPVLLSVRVFLSFISFAKNISETKIESFPVNTGYPMDIRFISILGTMDM